MNNQVLHLSDEEIQKYLNEQLNEYARQAVEIELELCKYCMERFIIAIEQDHTINNNPMIDDQQRMIERVISNIKLEQKSKKTYWIQRPFAQYAIAASITIILTVTGLFSSVTEQLLQIDRSHYPKEQLIQQEASESKSEAWLGKTIQWLDQVKEARFNQSLKGGIHDAEN